MNKRSFYKCSPEIVVNKNELEQQVEIDVDNMNFYKQVFAEDPVTGNPRSDIGYLLTGDDEGFKAYIKEKLFNSMPSSTSSLADNPDDALQVVKPNLMTNEQFAGVMKDYVLSLADSINVE